MCYFMLCYVMLCYVMLCYVMLCYVMYMLCYVRFTIVQSHGQEFAFVEDMLYILGSFNPQSVDLNDENLASFDFFGITSIDAYMIVSRIRASDAISGNLQWLQIACTGGGTNHTMEWSALDQCAIPWKLFAPVVSEPSLHWDIVTHTWVMISLEVVERSVRKCTSIDITGPWLCALVADIAQHPVWGSEEFILYGAKAHPEIRTKRTSTHPTQGSASYDNLVISYIPNAVVGPSALYSEANNAAYTPKFISLETKV